MRSDLINLWFHNPDTFRATSNDDWRHSKSQKSFHSKLIKLARKIDSILMRRVEEENPKCERFDDFEIDLWRSGYAERSRFCDGQICVSTNWPLKTLYGIACQKSRFTSPEHDRSFYVAKLEVSINFPLMSRHMKTCKRHQVTGDKLVFVNININCFWEFSLEDHPTMIHRLN